MHMIVVQIVDLESCMSRSSLDVGVSVDFSLKRIQPRYLINKCMDVRIITSLQLIHEQFPCHSFAGFWCW